MDEDRDHARAAVLGARTAIVNNWDCEIISEALGQISDSLKDEQRQGFVLIWTGIQLAAQAIVAADMPCPFDEACIATAIGDLISETVSKIRHSQNTGQVLQ